MKVVLSMPDDDSAPGESTELCSFDSANEEMIVEIRDRDVGPSHLPVSIWKSIPSDGAGRPGLMISCDGRLVIRPVEEGAFQVNVEEKPEEDDDE
jgi:hypothetical protein